MIELLDYDGLSDQAIVNKYLQNQPGVMKLVVLLRAFKADHSNRTANNHYDKRTKTPMLTRELQERANPKALDLIPKKGFMTEKTVKDILDKHSFKPVILDVSKKLAKER